MSNLRRSWGILVLWALALLLALASGRDLAFNLFYFVTVVIVVALVWSRLNATGLKLKRASRSQRSQVGRYFDETLELGNRSAWPKLWVEVTDESELPGHHVSRVVNGLGRGASSRWQVRTFCRQRGRYTLGPVTLSTGDPLGIFSSNKLLPETSSLLVTPATVELPMFSPPSGYLPGGEALHRRTPYVTASVAGVRDYAPGDSLNRIHWASTARTGRLISKEFELDPLADVWIFLDMYEPAHAAQPWSVASDDRELPWLDKKREHWELPPSTVEYGVTIAASLAQHYLRSDREVGFLSYADRREVVMPDRGERQLSRLMELLAVIEPAGRVPLPQVLATDGANLARHTTLVVITASTDSRWVTVLRGLRSRGVHGVAVLMAGQTFGAAPDWSPVTSDLQASGMPGYLVRYGDDIAEALGRPISGAGRRNN